MTNAITRSLLAAAILTAPSLLPAEITSPSKDIIIEQPTDLPEVAQHQGQDLLVRQDGHGDTYLYVEQHQGGRIAVLDVTDPSRIVLASKVETSSAVEFDFVRSLSDSAELVRFRDGSGFAELNLRRPKAPRLSSLPAMAQGRTEMLAQGGFLQVSQPDLNFLPQAQAHNVQVFSAARHSIPALLTTVDGVKRTAESGNTGTLFLLGSHGLTVVRQPDAEREYQNEQSIEEHN